MQPQHIGSWSLPYQARVFGLVAWALTAVLYSQRASADDLPFLRTSTAMVEADDEQIFEISASNLLGKQERNAAFQLGYSFSPTFSVEAEVGFGRDKVAPASSHELGLNVLNAWVDPAREGWGFATEFGVERERTSGEGWDDPGWKGILVFSVPLDERSLWLHANVGARYQSGDEATNRWAGLWSVAAQKELSRRFQLFGEFAGISDSSDRVAQVGVRTWIKREKLALNVGVGRQMAEGRKGNFVSLGFSFFDLSL